MSECELSTGESYSDGEYAFCPYCSEAHGDCWGWLTSEEPVVTKCAYCEREFEAFAVHQVMYHTRPIKAREAGDA